MNEENLTTQYDVIVKNETPYPQKKHYRSWVEVYFLWPAVTSYSTIAHS